MQLIPDNQEGSSSESKQSSLSTLITCTDPSFYDLHSRKTFQDMSVVVTEFSHNSHLKIFLWNHIQPLFRDGQMTIGIVEDFNDLWHWSTRFQHLEGKNTRLDKYTMVHTYHHRTHLWFKPVMGCLMIKASFATYSMTTSDGMLSPELTHSGHALFTEDSHDAIVYLF